MRPFSSKSRRRARVLLPPPPGLSLYLPQSLPPCSDEVSREDPDSQPETDWESAAFHTGFHWQHWLFHLKLITTLFVVLLEDYLIIFFFNSATKSQTFLSF